MIEDPYVAFCFDQAINYFGTTISNEMDDVEGDKKEQIAENRKRVLESYLNPIEEGKIPKGRFADPMALFS